MKVVALQEYTDKYISMYEGEIRNVTDEVLLQDLIEKQILAEKTDEEEETPAEEIILEFTQNEDTQEWSCNYTSAEISNINYSKTWIKINGVDYPGFLRSMQGSTRIWFVRMSFNEYQGLVLNKITLTENDAITVQELTYTVS